MDSLLQKTSEFIDNQLPKIDENDNLQGAQWQGLVRPAMPEPFISRPTLKALRITIKSIIDLVELLHSPDYEFDYVLTGKFNQDSLEVFKLNQCFLVDVFIEL